VTQNVLNALVHTIIVVNAFKIINWILMEQIIVIWINFVIQHAINVYKKITKINA
jgi:hypothetical protein